MFISCIHYLQVALPALAVHVPGHASLAGALGEVVAADEEEARVLVVVEGEVLAAQLLLARVQARQRVVLLRHADVGGAEALAGDEAADRVLEEAKIKIECLI